MSRSRFFLTSELPADSPLVLPLSRADQHHAIRVLRVGVGEDLDVVAPSGAVWRVRVAGVSRAGIAVEPLAELPPARQPDVALFQGVAKGDKMDVIVRQAVEVGAAKITPVLMSRSVVRLDPGRRPERGERWRRVARAAAKQARRETVPDVADPVEFAEALELLNAYDRIVVLWEDQRGRLLSTVVRSWLREPEARIALLVGPEGGLSAEEVAALQARGALVASLGPSIMRTETAAIVALSLVVAAMQEAGATDET